MTVSRRDGNDGSADDDAPRDGIPPFSPRLFRFFVLYLERYFARHFTAVRISRAGLPSPALPPRIIYTNHPTWWDPILFALLGYHLFPGQQLFGPMDAEALEKYPLLKRLGIFGVEQNTLRGATTFLLTSRAILRQPTTILFITPEGRFRDPRQRPVEILPGLGHLAKALDDTVIVPLALEYPFWNERHPEILVRFGTPISTRDGAGRTVAEWTRLFGQRLEETLDALATEAISRDPARFQTLLAGRTGIGGIYDQWRRLRAWRRGERFQPAHSDDPR